MPLSGAGARCFDKWHYEAPRNDLERLRELTEKATAGPMLRERIEKLPRYEHGMGVMCTWPGGDWLKRNDVLAALATAHAKPMQVRYCGHEAPLGEPCPICAPAPERETTHGDAPSLGAYDAGLLNDFGGGNVGWWLDSLRQHLAQAHEFYQEQVNNSWPATGAAPAGVGLRALKQEISAKYANGNSATAYLISRDLERFEAALRAIPDKSAEKEPR